MPKKQVKRYQPRARRKSGAWAVLGLHGGKEGKEWQKGKVIVRTAKNNIDLAVRAKTQEAMERIEKLRISASDKDRLMRLLRM